MIVVTGHVGYQWDRIALRTLPLLEDYCARNGYDLWDVPLGQYAEDRAPSWGKVPALARILNDSDRAVWVDADVLVSPDAPPIHEAMPEGAWQALAFHDVPEGDIPNCGVWVVTPAMVPVLETIWNDAAAIDHVWWEQAAVMRLLGYDTATWPILAAHRVPTELSEHTVALSGGWNAHPCDRRTDLMDGAWFRHATPGSNRDRLALLDGWAREWGL